MQILENGRQSFFGVTASELLKGLQLNAEGELRGLVPPTGWQEINSFTERGRLDPYKVLLKNPDLGIFVKIYTPETGEYAQAAYQALLSLAKLDLRYPVLPPEGISSLVLFFQLGEPKGKITYQDCFTNQQRDAIDSVLSEKALTSLWLQDHIDMVRISGIDYAVDPFDDCPNAVCDFINK